MTATDSDAWPLWDVHITTGLGVRIEVVKAPTTRKAEYCMQWELDWQDLRQSVLRVVPSEHPEDWDGKLIYTGRHQSVRA